MDLVLSSAGGSAAQLRKGRYLPLKGIMGGYQPIEITSAQARNGGKGVATNGNRDCASEYKSMAAYARTNNGLGSLR